MFNGLFSAGSSGPSTPKRTSTLKAAPLPSKLTTVTSPTDYISTSHPRLPPTKSWSPAAQWEHVNKGPSPSSDAESDTIMFEELSCSPDDIGDQSDGGGVLQLSPKLPALSPTEWQEERDQLRQQLDAALVAQRQAESDRDRWERNVLDSRASIRLERDKERGRIEALKAENEKLRMTLQHKIELLDAAHEETRRKDSPDDDGERARGGGVLQSPPTAPAPSVSAKWQEERDLLRQQLDAALAAQRKTEKGRTDVLEAENERLKATLQQQTQHLDAAREETKREHMQRQSEMEKLESALSAARRSHNEAETLKTSLWEHMRRIEILTVERERARKEKDSIKEDLSAEIERLKATNAKEAEQFMVAVEEDSLDRLQAHSELQGTKASLEACVLKLEASAREIDALRCELSKTKESSRVAAELKQRLEAQNKALQSTQEELSALKKEFGRLTTLLEDRTSELREARTSLDACTSKLDDSLREIDALRHELSNSKDSSRMAAELKQRLEMQNKALSSAREETSALKREFNQLTTLLEDRTSKLTGAQSFLSTADALSSIEVTSTLQKLNTEVLQGTAFMAESMVEMFFHKTVSQASKTDEQLAAGKRASPEIGGALVHFLGTKRHEDDPILIQIAFQAYVIYRLRWMASTWIIGRDEGHNQFIDAMYRNVRERESQAIAGRWRALTRTHVPSTPLDESQIAFQISTKMIAGLSDILLISGCAAPKADITAALSSKFAIRLSSLASLAIRLNKIIGENVTSGDFEVLAVQPGTAFDAMTMANSYGDGGSAKGRGAVSKVLCATDLGLRKKTRVAMKGEKQWETEVLLKPKVALESVVDVLDE